MFPIHEACLATPVLNYLVQMFLKGRESLRNIPRNTYEHEQIAARSRVALFTIMTIPILTSFFLSTS